MRAAFRSLLLIAIMFGVALVWWGSRSQTPIPVLAEGRSNMARFLPYTWAQERNLYIWNHFRPVQGTEDVGAACMPAPAFRMNISYAFANEIAEANPDVSVYAVNESYPSLDISH